MGRRHGPRRTASHHRGGHHVRGCSGRSMARTLGCRSTARPWRDCRDRMRDCRSTPPNGRDNSSTMTPTEQVLAALTSHGLLLKQDKAIPNVVGIITGESLRTSWWSHPKGRLIFSVLSELADHPDVLFTKLLHRKDTLVHRSLWSALLAIARSREPWQLRGLSASATSLLDRVDHGEGPVRASGAPVKELETHLLTVAREVHTES